MKKILLLFIIVSVMFFSGCKNNLTRTDLDLAKTEINSKENDLSYAISKYNLEDKYLEKNIDGHIICRNDLNCLFRYYMECKPSNGLFFDNSLNKAFGFSVVNSIDGKCVFNIISYYEDIKNKTCLVDLDNLSKINFESILNDKIRKGLNYCKDL